MEDMAVFRLSMELALEVERESRHFGPDFRWLRIQMLKSSESVPSNITEGFYAQYSTEYLQSLYRARREARETQSHLHYAEGCKQMSADVTARGIRGYEDVLMQVANLIGSIERKIASMGKSKPTAFVIKESQGDYLIEFDSLSNHELSTINHPTMNHSVRS